MDFGGRVTGRRDEVMASLRAILAEVENTTGCAEWPQRPPSEEGSAFCAGCEIGTLVQKAMMDLEDDMTDELPEGDQDVEARRRHLAEEFDLTQGHWPGAVAVACLEVARIAREAWSMSGDELQAWASQHDVALGADIWTVWAEPRAVELLDQLRAAGYRIDLGFQRPSAPQTSPDLAVEPAKGADGRTEAHRWRREPG